MAGDIWEFPTLAGKRFAAEKVDHPTQKPMSISRRIVKHFSENKPDVFIGVDSPDFNFKIEQKLKKRGVILPDYLITRSLRILLSEGKAQLNRRKWSTSSNFESKGTSIGYAPRKIEIPIDISNEEPGPPTEVPESPPEEEDDSKENFEQFGGIDSVLAKGSWGKFRNIISYYMECVRNEEGASASSFIDEIGKKYLFANSISNSFPKTGKSWSYVIPMGSNFALVLGGKYLQGKGKVAATNSDVANTAGNVSFEFDDHITGYIAPTLILSDTSSIYLKVGVSEAATTVSGDITTPADLSGQMLAIGTRTVLDSGIFIRTEAGYTDYNGIGARGKGEGTVAKDLISTTTKFSADPTIVHGVISLGFRF